jgi:hypothetical protein
MLRHVVWPDCSIALSYHLVERAIAPLFSYPAHAFLAVIRLFKRGLSSIKAGHLV